MRRILVITLLTLSLVVNRLGAVSAESLQAYIYYEPDNTITADVETTLRIQIDDPLGTFGFENCDCVLKITSPTDIIDTVELSGAGSRSITNYRFVAEGTYSIILNGTPLGLSTFDPFTIDLGSPTTVAISSRNPLLNLVSRLAVFAAVVVVFLLFFLIPARAQKRKTKPQTQGIAHTKAASKKV